ncbi:hypothetical protein HKCCE2091_10575 [Rhodobacterales bacterium HKCCE2091]|nr:hypothetical protein [Rhodobacterales bacterium HKCCE2091]
MKRIAAALLVLALAGPAAAQEADGDNDFRDGLDLFGEGARRMLEGFREEMGPLLDEMRPFFEEEMLPFLQELSGLIDDISAYELPERLPNGDIIIRRRPDAPDLPDVPGVEIDPDGGVDL